MLLLFLFYVWVLVFFVFFCFCFVFFVIFDIIFGFLSFFCVDCINFRWKVLILDDFGAVLFVLEILFFWILGCTNIFLQQYVWWSGNWIWGSTGRGLRKSVCCLCFSVFVFMYVAFCLRVCFWKAQKLSIKMKALRG